MTVVRGCLEPKLATVDDGETKGGDDYEMKITKR